jgi:hypothetical protein
MESLWMLNNHVFESPFACLIAGPSQSGKTSLLFKLLKHNHEIFNPIPDRIVYCYSTSQPFFTEFQNISPPVEFHKGLKNADEFDKSKNNLLIIDDLMDECESNKEIQSLFTKDSHHHNISVFIVSQNIFPKGKYARTISLNCQYLIIFNNPRDKNQINTLARQMFCEKTSFFFEALKDIFDNHKHAYIFFDLRVSTLEKNRIQTGIVPGETRLIYTKKC